MTAKFWRRAWARRMADAVRRGNISQATLDAHMKMLCDAATPCWWPRSIRAVHQRYLRARLRRELAQ